MQPKVILITGASSGIGKATARKLLEAGHIVYGAARSTEKMTDLEPLGLHILKLDITKKKDVETTVSTIMKEQGRIDVLCNNAGFGVFGSVEEVPLDDARHQFEVNLFGLAQLTQLVLPIMRKQRSGKIINTSSMGGKMYTPLGAWYHATKHALEGWSDCLRFEVQQFGIDVVIIEPGIINTNFGDVMMGPMKQYSGSGPYKNIVEGMSKSGDKSYGKPENSSDPSVIADVIAEAVTAKKPKTRYPAGKLAKPLIFIRQVFGDRFFDRLLRLMVK